MFCYNFVKSEKQPKGNNYKPVTDIMSWTEKSVSESTKVPTELKPFLTTIKTYQIEKHDFQKDINNQYLVKPVDIIKSNARVELVKPNYSEVGTLNNFNATDTRNLAKSLKDETIKSYSYKFANDDLKKYYSLKNKDILTDKKNNENMEENK